MNDASRFELHPRLTEDCRLLGDLFVSRLLLMNDRRFPWCILVPRLAGLTELHHLPADARAALLDEVEAVSLALLEHAGAAKINVAALGNRVPQLHLHVVGRRPDDAAWPGPVWGHGTAQPYDAAAIDAWSRRLRDALGTALRPLA